MVAQLARQLELDAGVADGAVADVRGIGRWEAVAAGAGGVARGGKFAGNGFDQRGAEAAEQDRGAGCRLEIAVDGDGEVRALDECDGPRFVEASGGEVQVAMTAVRLQALEAVERVALRGEAGGDERRTRLDRAAVWGDDGSGRVAVDQADGIGDAFRLGGGQFGKAPVAIGDLGAP